MATTAAAFVENVDAPMGLRGKGHHALGAAGLGEIDRMQAPEVETLGDGGFDNQAIGTGRVEVAADDLRPVACHHQGGAAADAAGDAGDDGDLSGEAVGKHGATLVAAFAGSGKRAHKCSTSLTLAGRAGKNAP